MPDLSLDALRVAVILLPGFLSSKIKDFFIAPRKLTAFDHFMEVAAFAVANYVAASVVLDLGGRGVLTYFFQLSVSALVLGVLAGVVVGRDYHYRLARALRLTSRTGREDVWQDSFAEFEGNWIVLHMEDGNRLRGWALFYSDAGSSPSAFLRKASWFDPMGHETPVNGEGVLVTQLANVRYVEFLGTEGAAA